LRAITADKPVPTYTYSSLVDEYGDSLYKFCRRLTFSKEDAEDLFQESFLNIYVNMAKISSSANPKSFLFSTTLYIWKGWKRKYARRKRLAPIGPLDDTIASGANTEDSFIEKDEVHTVRKLVASLPDKYRIPTIMYYTAELAVDEIAAALKLPAGTVKSRLFKSRKLIEKGLRAYE
jgi:RNA polymerase sigma-70 factor (ECF subfamily)